MCIPGKGTDVQCKVVYNLRLTICNEQFPLELLGVQSSSHFSHKHFFPLKHRKTVTQIIIEQRQHIHWIIIFDIWAFLQFGQVKNLEKSKHSIAKMVTFSRLKSRNLLQPQIFLKQNPAFSIDYYADNKIWWITSS